MWLKGRREARGLRSQLQVKHLQVGGSAGRAVLINVSEAAEDEWGSFSSPSVPTCPPRPVSRIQMEQIGWVDSRRGQKRKKRKKPPGLDLVRFTAIFGRMMMECMSTGHGKTAGAVSFPPSR